MFNAIMTGIDHIQSLVYSINPIVMAKISGDINFCPISEGICRHTLPGARKNRRTVQNCFRISENLHIRYLKKGTVFL